MKQLILLIGFLALASCQSGNKEDTKINAEITTQLENNQRKKINLGAIGGPEWERVCIIGPYAGNALAEKIMGFKWDVEGTTYIQDSDSFNVLVFIKDKSVTSFVTYPRVPVDFSSFSGKCFNRNEATLVFYQDPLATCFDYRGEERKQHPRCLANFKQDCLSQNGVVEGMLRGPALYQLACFQKAPDAGKACSEDQDCLSGLCNLKSSNTSKKCRLDKKEYSDVRNNYYTATYLCKTPKPGQCTISPHSEEGFGSNTRISRTMNQNILIETRKPGVQF